MHNSMVMFTFSVLDLEYPFWGNFGKKSPGLIQVCIFVDVHFFSFGQEIPFLGKFVPKNQTCNLR